MKIIIVLGVGRSGTSLLMQILENLGISGSRNTIPAHAANKYGSKEDEDIFAIHAELQSSLNSVPHLPLPEGWLRNPKTIEAREKLTEIIGRHIESEMVFALKDPKINSFLPMWQQIFNKLRIVPIYLFAARSYSSTASSFIRQYNSPPKVIEAIWIVRTLDALNNCGLDCHIVHYEDWLSQPESTLKNLRDYLGKFEIKSLDFDVKSLIDVNSMHTSADHVSTDNQVILNLESELDRCRDDDCNRASLSHAVRSGLNLMKCFGSWSDTCNKTLQQNATLQGRVKKLEKQILYIEKNMSTATRLADLRNELESCCENIEHLYKLSD